MPRNLSLLTPLHLLFELSFSWMEHVHMCRIHPPKRLVHQEEQRQPLRGSPVSLASLETYSFGWFLGQPRGLHLMDMPGKTPKGSHVFTSPFKCGAVSLFWASAGFPNPFVLPLTCRLSSEATSFSSMEEHSTVVKIQTNKI